MGAHCAEETVRGQTGSPLPEGCWSSPSAPLGSWGDEVCPAEDLSRGSFCLGALGGLKPPGCPAEHRLALITTPRIILEQKKRKREESRGPGLVRKSQGKAPQLQSGICLRFKYGCKLNLLKAEWTEAEGRP